jgi:hypothetical protein
MPADSSSKPRATGADLAALFAECDHAALPRQHAWTYLDPSWAVDDIQPMERAMTAGGRGGGGGGVGLYKLNSADPYLETAWFHQPLSLSSGKLVSNFAFSNSQLVPLHPAR